MKTLNSQAVKVLTAMLERDKLTTDDPNRELKADVIHDFGRYRIINVTHYRADDGWQIREPELTILHDTLTDEYIPSNIRNDYARINSNSASIYGGQLTVHNEKIQADHTEFANRWLAEIAEQL